MLGKVPALVALAAVTVALAAPAQADAPEPLAKTLRGPASRAYEAGRLLFQDRDYAGALVQFQQAYQAQPDPRLLWNIAVCEKYLRHYRRARDFIRRYLREGEVARLLTPSDVAEANAILEALPRFIGTVTVEVNEPGATVFLDGVEIGTTPPAPTFEADVGPHTLAVSKPGFREARVMHDVAGGTHATREILLEPARGTLQVNVKPGGEIFLDGVSVGEDKWTGSVPAGRHSLQVNAGGRKPYSSEITIDDRESRQVTVVLERDSSVWMWVAVGTVVVGAAAVTGYMWLQEDEARIIDGSLGRVQLGIFPGFLW